MTTPLETMKVFVLNRLGTMTNPLQIVKVFVLNSLDLVQEKKNRSFTPKTVRIDKCDSWMDGR